MSPTWPTPSCCSRYFEAVGEVRRCYLGDQASAAAPTRRPSAEFQIGGDGLTVGRPLTGFHGVLRGVPNFVGQGSGLVGDASA